jgi:hypothetical protein
LAVRGRSWLLVLLVACCSGCGSSTTLTKHAFTKDAESLQSFAAEAALLAGQVAEGEGTTYFTRVHSDYLAKDAKKVETTLRAADAVPEVDGKRAAGARLAARIYGDIARLHRSPRDRALASRMRADLLDAADAAGQLAE